MTGVWMKGALGARRAAARHVERGSTVADTAV